MTTTDEKLRELAEKATPGPWDCVPSDQHHGPYITTDFGSTIADLYTMTLPNERSTANGGPSKPMPFLHEWADPNAAFIAAANPATILSLLDRLSGESALRARVKELEQQIEDARANEGPSDSAIHQMIEEAIDAERNRCAKIVYAARMGEVDQDFRTIGHMILGGRSIEEIKDILK